MPNAQLVPSGATFAWSQQLSPWLRFAEAASGIFSPGEEVLSDDPLVDVVRRDPHAAARFIRTVMVFSGCGSMVVCMACLTYLFLFWRLCGHCDRPLRWWILMHSILQLVQVPVRFVFLAKIRRAEAGGHSVEACVTSYTASPAWRASKNLSLVTYGWFVLGIVWVVNAGDCSACRGIYRMTISVIAQAIARAIIALLIFRWLFPPSEMESDGAPKVRGAAAERIAALPALCFSSCLFKEPGLGCAVCLCEYNEGDTLRRLPCNHNFHRRCADEWLHRSKRCPLCMQDIDAPVFASMKLAKAQ